VARFEVGDHAPDFSATTYDGNKIRPADFLGKRALVLFFYPKDGTPICTQEACGTGRGTSADCRLQAFWGAIGEPGLDRLCSLNSAIGDDAGAGLVPIELRTEILEC
jgi:hypothetical protein